MTSVRLLEGLAAQQQGCVARWQLIAAGCSPARCDSLLAGLRRLHDGVYLTGYAAPTPLQRWWAATLTAPRSVLSHDSAACFWEIATRDPAVVTITRPGRTNPQRLNRLHVRYSATLDGHVTRRRGLAVTTPERTVMDVWPSLRGNSADRLLRDAIRLQRTSFPTLVEALDTHRGRRGIASLRERCAIYVRLPLDRCKSDAEVEGLVVVDAAGLPLPEVNVKRAGEEADFSWPERRLIVEIDGPQFHRDPLEDARKTRVWTLAGWTVHRMPSDDVYHHPERLLVLAGS